MTSAQLEYLLEILKMWPFKSKDSEDKLIMFKPKEDITVLELAAIVNAVSHLKETYILKDNWDTLPQNIKRHWVLLD